MPRLPAHLQSSPFAPGQIPREVLAGHQRERVLAAVTVAFAERGYKETSVDDLLAAGKVGVGNFYSLFEGKEDCFLAAFDRVVEHFRERIRAAAEEEEGWAERAYLGTAAFVRCVVEEPLPARLVLVEAQSAGTAAGARYEGLLDTGAGWLAEARKCYPAAEGLPPHHEVASVSGLAFFLQVRLLDSFRLDLGQLFGEIAGLVLEPIIGSAELRRLRRAFAPVPGGPAAQAGKARKTMSAGGPVG